MSPAHAPPHTPRRLSINTALAFSAGVLLVLVAVLALRTGADAPQAHAIPFPLTLASDSAVQAGEFTLLTFNAANNEDLVAVLDSRAERLFVYSVDQQRFLVLLDNQRLADIFAVTRRLGAGRAP